MLNELNRKGDIGFTLANAVVLIIVFFAMIVFVIISGYIGAIRADTAFDTDFGSSDRSFLFEKGKIEIDGKETGAFVFEAVFRFLIDEKKILSLEQGISDDERKSQFFDEVDLESFFKRVILADGENNKCLIFNRIRGLGEREIGGLPPGGAFLIYKNNEFQTIEGYNDYYYIETNGMIEHYAELGVIKYNSFVLDDINGNKIGLNFGYYYGKCLEPEEAG